MPSSWPQNDTTLSKPLGDTALQQGDKCSHCVGTLSDPPPGTPTSNRHPAGEISVKSRKSTQASWGRSTSSRLPAGEMADSLLLAGSKIQVVSSRKPRSEGGA